MTPHYFLGLDLGTSGCKGVLLDQVGEITATTDAWRYTTFHPNPGWSEQNPEDWLKAAQECIRQAIQRAGVDAGQPVALPAEGLREDRLLPDDPAGGPLARSGGGPASAPPRVHGARRGVLGRGGDRGQGRAPRVNEPAAVA